MEELTNRELSTLITTTGENLSIHLKRIEEQTIRTNGRVSILEKWKNMTIGGLVITNVILLPVFLMLLQRYLK